MVRHSLLKLLYYNDFFNRKQIIEDLEAGLTVAPKETPNTNDVDFDEVGNADEAITAEAKDSNDMENDLKE